jgi:hypothetical protein
MEKYLSSSPYPASPNSRGEVRHLLPTSAKNSPVRHLSTKPAIETNEYGVISLLRLVARGAAKLFTSIAESSN